MLISVWGTVLDGNRIYMNSSVRTLIALIRPFRRKRQRARQKFKSVTISFPNPSRSYDAGRQVVRFWGYDSAMEKSFFMTADALMKIQPALKIDEASLLRAFDGNRDRIYAVAAKIYARGHKGSYELSATNF